MATKKTPELKAIGTLTNKEKQEQMAKKPLATLADVEDFAKRCYMKKFGKLPNRGRVMFILDKVDENTMQVKTFNVGQKSVAFANCEIKKQAIEKAKKAEQKSKN